VRTLTPDSVWSDIRLLESVYFPQGKKGPQAMGAILKPEDREDSLIAFYFGREGDYLAMCISRGYRDMQRTLSGIYKHKNKMELRSVANMVLGEFLEEAKAVATSGDFDDWHREACERLCSVYREYGFEGFTAGHAQKWVNMTLKYIYVMDGRIKGFDHLYEFCHVPFDNILIEALKKHGFEAPGDVWSKLDYDTYSGKQRWIRKHFKGLCPMDVEFKLWLGRSVPECGCVK
jgi:hypothetical protein